MANQEQVALLRQGSERWNTWRKQQPGTHPELHEAYLANANLSCASLSNADLREANLSRTNLTNADLREADLRNANLVSTDLRNADLRGADLSFADLRGADLRGADLASADLGSAYLTGTRLDPPGTKTTQRISTSSPGTPVAPGRGGSGSSRSQERPRYSTNNHSPRADRRPFWAALGFAALLTFSFFLALLHYIESFQHFASNGQTLDIVAARGETITFTMHMGDSVNGLWGSNNGLGLTLQGISQTLPALAPKPPSWGDSISTENWVGGESFTVSGSFTIPSSIGGPEEQMLTGSITGDIVYPNPTGGFEFEDTPVNITIPIRLHLIPSGSLPWVSGEILLVAVIGLDVILLVALPVSLRFYHAQRAGGMTLNTKGLIVGVIIASVLGGLLFLVVELGLPSTASVATFFPLWGSVALVSGVIGWGMIRARQRGRK